MWPFRVGMYKDGAYNFSFEINNNYPHEPPKVKCTQTVSTAEGLVLKLMINSFIFVRFTTLMSIWRATSA